MKIKKVIIKNYKIFVEYTIDFNEDLNILVGDNETGKSTILEAINLALTGKLNNSLLQNDISPYLFNKDISDKYIEDIKEDKKPKPPEILIEVYFYETDNQKDNNLRGIENSLTEDCIGLCLEIKLNEEFREIYNDYIDENKSSIKTIPTEYYIVSRRDFSAGKKGISIYEKKYQPIFVDTTTINIHNGNDYFVQNIIYKTLDTKEQKKLSINYKVLKETFSDNEDIKKVNAVLTKNSDITDDHSDMSISLDISSKSNWLRNLVGYVNNIPLSFIGKGKQNKIKINLALNKGKEISDVVLIDEPENHLSFPRLNSLISNIRNKSEDKQLIITTHSHFITNKLGLSKLVLLNDIKDKPLYLTKKLDDDTQNYFMKLSDYDTLRLALSKKTILVEGPSDSLIVQKIYRQIHGILPIEDEDPVDIIIVRGLAFKRFLNIARHLESTISVITDNDGEEGRTRIVSLKEYETEKIKIFPGDVLNSKTLEPSLINTKNNEEIIKKILNKEDATKDELIDYMSRDKKTDVALEIFESSEKIDIPLYIESAIEHVKKQK